MCTHKGKAKRNFAHTAFVENFEVLADQRTRVVASEHIRAHIELTAVVALTAIVNFEEGVRGPALVDNVRDTCNGYARRRIQCAMLCKTQPRGNMLIVHSMR